MIFGLLPPWSSTQAGVYDQNDVKAPYLQPGAAAIGQQQRIIEVYNNKTANPQVEMYQLNNRSFQADLGDGTSKSIPYGGTENGEDYPHQFELTNWKLDMTPYKPTTVWRDKDGLSYYEPDLTTFEVADAEYRPQGGVYSGSGSAVPDAQYLTIGISTNGKMSTDNRPFSDSNAKITVPPYTVKRVVTYVIDMMVYWKGRVVTTKTLNASTAKPTLKVGDTSNSTATVTTTGYQASGGAVDVNNNATTTWSSDKSAVAEVDSSTGRIKANGVGTATITVRWQKEDEYGLNWNITRSFTVTVTTTDGGGPTDPTDPPPEANIAGDFDILPSTINYRDTFALQPKNIVGTNGCTYVSHKYRIEGRGELTSVFGQNTTSTFPFGSYPYGIGVGTHQISLKINGTTCESGWIATKTLTILGPANNNPPFFKLGWFANGDWTSRTSVPQVVQGSTMMVRIIETPDTTPPSPSDPDGDDFWLSSWDFSNNAWTQSLPGKYGFHPQADYVSGIVMDTPGYHTIRATLTDEFGAQSTAQTTVQVIPPNPVAVITGPEQVKEGRPLPTPFSSANSFSPIGRPIDHAKDEWTNLKTTYTTPGTEVIGLHVYDDQGRKSLQQATHNLTVLPDDPPVAKLEIVPIGIRGQTYYVYNRSYSSDGDTIATVEYRVRYDSNNNGFGDDSWTTLTGDMNRAAFTPNRVGKYQLYVKATEPYGRSDDTLSDPLSVTMIDIHNLAPEVSFQIEGRNPQPDHSPEMVYTPQTIINWELNQVNSNHALPGRLSRWSAGTNLAGGLGKKRERLYSFSTSGTYWGHDYNYSWMHPYADNGFGANGLSPYRPIAVNNPAYSQPLLVPSTSGGWTTPGAIQELYTTRTHVYFVHGGKFYALNKDKVGRYQQQWGAWGSFSHSLPDGSYYDYIVTLDDPSNLQERYVTKYRGDDYSAPWVVYKYKNRPGYDYSAFLQEPQILATAYANDVVYQVVRWKCVCGNWDEYWKQYDTHYLNDLRVTDLKTGTLLYSSMENQQSVPSDLIYGNIYGFGRGSNGVFKNNQKFFEFNKLGTFVRSVSADLFPPLEKYVHSTATARCSPSQGTPYEGIDGEIYIYLQYLCYEKTEGYRINGHDEVYVVKFNSDLSLAWKTKLPGTLASSQGSTMYSGYDAPNMVVNPFAKEVVARSYELIGFTGYSYTHILDMDTGAIKTKPAWLELGAQSGTFDIDWGGNYIQKTSGGTSYTSYGTKYYFGGGDSNSTNTVTNQYNDGTYLSSFQAGGVIWAGGGWAGSAQHIVHGEYIGDGLFLSYMQETSPAGTNVNARHPWLNKGTPANVAPVVPGFTLGQFLSPFALGNHEMSFALTMDDADYDRDLAGFSFRAQNGTNRYALEADGAILYLSKYVNGARTVLQQANYPFADGTAVTFKIKTLGSRIEVYVNGAPYFDVTDGTWASGKVGPFSNKSFVKFGTVTAKEVKAPDVVWSQDVALWDAGAARAEVRYTNIVFTDPENDPAGPYRWRFAHTPKFIANQGVSALHGQTFSSTQLHFDKVGVYDVTLSAEDDPHPNYLYPSMVFSGYRKASNDFMKRILVHRKPVAAFTLSLNADKTVQFNDTSYDPDRWASSSVYSPVEDGKNYQTTRGIFERKYYYITPAGAYVEGQLTRPSEYGQYRVGLAVRDEYNAWSDWAVQTIQIDNPFPPNTPPVATMTYPSGTQASPTMETSRRPALRWNQTDVDPGTVFTRFQLQVTNESNTVTVIDSGELSQNATATTAQWTPMSDLPAGQRLRVRVRVFDGAEWSAWSAQTWLLINNAPAAELTFPTGTQAIPTVSSTPRPTIRWSQTDPDPGTVFDYFEAEISNEDNTIMIADSGQHYQHTSSGNGSWAVDADLPLGQKLRTRVRVFDGMAWSPWSAIQWLLVNRPPVADFAWTPAIVYEGDDVTLTNLSADPDGDALSYQWTVTQPDGSVLTGADPNLTLANVARGTYAVTLRATDPHGGSDVTTKAIVVHDLTIAGQVAHTDEWEAYRQTYNSKFPDRARAASDFWAGEALVLSARVTNTGSSATKPVSVTATLIETGDTIGLSSGNQAEYGGTMAETDHAKTLTDGPYVMRFTAQWSNGHAETDDVPFHIEGDIMDVIVNQQRL